MKIRSAVPENGCLINIGERKKQKKLDYINQFARSLLYNATAGGALW